MIVPLIGAGAAPAGAAPVALSISPVSASLLTGGTQQFTASVTGSSNTAVTWSVTGGSISSGLYTAPGTAGTYTVKATSVADSTKSASATVTVSAAPAVSITISPTSSSIPTGSTQQFTATVTGSSNTAVTWSVTGGSISSGLYTAPGTAGTYTVKATSVADSSKSASATVTVTSPLPPPPGAVPLLVQRTQESNSWATQLSNTPTIYTVRLPDGTQAGNTVAVVVRYWNSPVPTITVADDQSNSYTTSASCSALDTTTNNIITWYWAQNVAANTRTITVTFAAPSPVQYMTVHLLELANVGAFDGCSTGFGNSATVAAGNLTPTASGDMILQSMTKDQSDTQSTITAGSQSNIAWQLATADLQDKAATAVQWGIYNSTATFAPTMTTGGATNNNYVTSAIAFKAALAGSDLPSGIHIRGLLHFSAWGAQYSYTGPGWSNPLNIAAPSYGNALVMAVYGASNGTTMVNSITDTNGNTWQHTPETINNVGGVDKAQFWYCTPCTTSADLVLTVTAGASGHDYNLQIYDITGAASSAYDTDVGNTGVQNSFISPMPFITITPSQANGLVIFAMSQANNTVTGMGCAGCLVDIGMYNNESINGPENVDQNNGLGHVYPTSTNSITGSWTYNYASDAQTQWAARAISIKAASAPAPTAGSITITPGSAVVMPGATQQFTAAVSGSTNATVTWSATGGAVSTNGLYTAPPSAGTYTVTATVGNLTNSATVTVGSPVQHTVTLTWAADASPVAGYNVYRSTVSGGPYTRINNVLDAATNYVDNSVLSGQTYYYVTTAVNSGGAESTYSNQVVASVPSP